MARSYPERHVHDRLFNQHLLNTVGPSCLLDMEIKTGLYSQEGMRLLGKIDTETDNNTQGEIRGITHTVGNQVDLSLGDPHRGGDP